MDFCTPPRSGTEGPVKLLFAQFVYGTFSALTKSRCARPVSEVQHATSYPGRPVTSSVHQHRASPFASCCREFCLAVGPFFQIKIAEKNSLFASDFRSHENRASWGLFSGRCITKSGRSTVGKCTGPNGSGDVKFRFSLVMFGFLGPDLLGKNGHHQMALSSNHLYIIQLTLSIQGHLFWAVLEMNRSGF